MKSAVQFLLFVVIGFAVVVVGVRVFQGGVAETPEALAGEMTLSGAMDESRETGKPVLAVVTADWCGPCQALKRGALADAEVSSWIEANTVAVAIDADASPDDARSLGVSSIPATIVLKDGQIADRMVGNVGADDYLAFLKSAVGGE